MKDVDFTHRVHIDIADGQLAPKLIDADKVWWPHTMEADIHMMYKQPLEHLEKVILKKPQLVILHAEAEGDFYMAAEALRAAGIRTGVALLPETAAITIQPALDMIDHVLVFSGHLGHFGGHVNLDLLDKVRALKVMKPALEIGWDGGINDRNAHELAKAGVDVLNAGGFIHGAKDSKKAYATLKAKV
jgi:ribulose-phosphate 3-epimerase